MKRLQSFLGSRRSTNQEELKESRNEYQLSEDAKQLIIEYLSPPWKPRTIRAMQKHIKSELEESYSAQMVRRFIIKEMRYSYKKGLSRPHKYGTKRVQLVKVLYWFELLKLLIEEKIVINVDESSFDRSIKNHYSWLPKGENAPILNENIKRKATLILETWSTEEWFAVVIIGTVDFFEFWIFLKLLELVLKESYQDIQALHIVVLDNAPTHSSKLSKRILENLYYEVRFSAPYWPEVAPVELEFKKIKSKLRGLGGTTVINFDNENGIAKIFQLLQTIELASKAQNWINTVKVAKESIIKFKVEMMEDRNDEDLFEQNMISKSQKIN